MMINARGRFGSFVKLGMWVGLCGFANVPNADRLRNFIKCEAGAFRILRLSLWFSPISIRLAFKVQFSLFFA